MNRISASFNSISKRTLSFMLAILMVFTAIPLYAFAAGDEPTEITAEEEATEFDISIPDQSSDPVPAPDPTPVATSGSQPSAGSQIFALSDDVWTVNFIYEGASYGTNQNIADGSYADDPGVPPFPSGMVSFRGWSLYNPATHPSYQRSDFFVFSSTAITGDTTLYAIFFDSYLISYKNAPSGTVVQTREVAPNASVPAPDDSTVNAITPPANTRLTFWYDESAATPTPFAFGATQATGDITLVPHFSSARLVLFNSAGTQVSPQYPEYENLATKPSPDPSRAGYTFSYWSTNPDATVDSRTEDEFLFTTPIITDTTLYAIWLPNNVGYTVVYWVEKPNIAGSPTDPAIDSKDYDYYSSFTVTGTGTTALLQQNAGAVVSFTNTQLNTLYSLSQRPGRIPSNATRTAWTDYYYTEYSKTISPKLNGDGSSIVNIYFNLRTYTLTFNMGGDERIIDRTTIPPTTYNTYTIQAKVGQNITASFPSISNPRAEIQTLTSGTNRYFTQFTTPAATAANRLADTGAWVSIRPTLTDVLVPINGTLPITLTADWGNSSTATKFNYMVEAIDQTAAATAYASGTTVTGAAYLRNVSGVLYAYGDFSGKGNTYYIQDTAISEVKYWTANNNYNNSVYHKPIDGMIAGQGIAVGAGATSGWANGYNTTGTNSITNPHQLFLYYNRSAYSLSFNLQHPTTVGEPTTIAPQLNIMYGKPLFSNKPGDPAWSGHVFVGWYLDAECSVGREFNFNTAIMPNGNLSLFAKWLLSDHTVRFYDGVGGTYLGSGFDKLVGDGSTLADPDYYTVGTAYEGHGMFQGWYWLVDNNAQYQLSFGFDNQPVYADLNLYAKWKTTDFTVTYTTEGAKAGSVAPVDSNKYALGSQSRVLDGSGIIPPDGYVFYGWTSVGQEDNVVSYPYNLHTMIGNTTYKPYFGLKTNSMTITYDPISGPVSDGTTPPGVVLHNHPRNSNINLADGIFTHPSYQLVGWATEAGGEKVYDLLGSFTTTTADLTLYAVWQSKLYTISFVAETGGTLTDGQQTSFPNIPAGTQWSAAISAVPTPVPDTVNGYTFDKWDPVIPATTSLINASIIYTAKFKLIDNLTVTYYANYSGASPAFAPDPHGAYTWGNDVTVLGYNGLPMPPRDGYQFTGWNAAADGSGAPYAAGATISSIKANVQLYAQWKPVVDIEDFKLSAAAQALLTKVYGDDDPLLLTVIAALNNELRTHIAIKYADNAEIISSDFVVDVTGRVYGEDVAGSPYSYTVTVNYPESKYILKGNVSAALTINPRPITITAGSDSKVYDGTPLIKNSSSVTSVITLAYDHYYDATVIGSQTEVGTGRNVVSDVIIKDGLGNVVAADNYYVYLREGTLEVTTNPTVLTITAKSSEKVYDGTPLTLNDFTYTTLPAGVTSVTATVTGSQTNAGNSANTITSYDLWNGTEKVTSNYPGVVKVPGDLKVLKVPITITAGSRSWIYDSASHSYDYASLTSGTLVSDHALDSWVVNGSQTIVGNSPNVITSAIIKYGSDVDVTENYFITLANGTLTVTPAEMTLSATGYSGIYDGQPHNGVVTYSTGVSGTFYSFSLDGTDDYPYTFVPQVTNVADSKWIFIKASHPNYQDAFFEVWAEVLPREISVVAASASKPYDGTPLTAPTANIITGSLAEGQTLTANVVGSQTEVGYSTNAIEGGIEGVAIWDEDVNVTDNYIIQLGSGTLTVTKGEIDLSRFNLSVIAGNLTKVYGNADPNVQQIIESAVRDWLSSTYGVPAGDLSQFYVGAYRNTGENVNSYAITVQVAPSKNYDITNSVNPTFNITPRPVTIIIGNATKVAGSADNFTGVTVSLSDFLAQLQLVLGGVHRVNGFTSEAAGTYAGVLTVDFINNPNFAVTIVNGTHTITAAPVIVPVQPPIIPGEIVPGPAPTTITNPTTPLASEPTTITDPDTPLAAQPTAAWALVNLILAIISLIFAIYLAIGYASRRKGQEEDKQKGTQSTQGTQGNQSNQDTRGGRGVAWRTIAVIFGVVSPIVFILTEDITLPMTFVDIWTILMAVFLVIQIIGAAVLHQSRKEHDDKGNSNAQQAAY